MPLLALTPEQRQASLEKAAQARKARVEVKEQLKTGKTTLAQVLADGKTSDVIGKMRVAELLQAVPGVGKIKAREAMQKRGLADTRRVRGLGPKQQAALVEQFTR